MSDGPGSTRIFAIRMTYWSAAYMTCWERFYHRYGLAAEVGIGFFGSAFPSSSITSVKRTRGGTGLGQRTILHEHLRRVLTQIIAEFMNTRF